MNFYIPSKIKYENKLRLKIKYGIKVEEEIVKGNMKMKYYWNAN
jgi:hypothetical protein